MQEHVYFWPRPQGPWGGVKRSNINKRGDLLWRAIDSLSSVLLFFSPFSIAKTSLGEERANLGAFCAFV